MKAVEKKPYQKIRTRTALLAAALLTIVAMSASAQQQQPPPPQPQENGLQTPAAADREPDLGRPVESLNATLLYIIERDSVTLPDGEQQFSAARRRWTAGQTIKVCFFDGRGNEVARTLVAAMARKWEAYANIRFDFGSPGVWYDCAVRGQGVSQVRILFDSRFFISLIGRDSEGEARLNTPSMQLGSIDTKYNSDWYTVADVVSRAEPDHKAAIIHEFGHVLGLLHEQQNPALKCVENIRWKGANNAYDILRKDPWRWDETQVNRNINFAYSFDRDGEAGAADPQSIMMYNLPPAIFLPNAPKECQGQHNVDISKLDQQLVASIYKRDAPKPNDAKTELGQIIGVVASEADPFTRADYLGRIIADLDAPDVGVRSTARSALATFLDRNDDSALSLELLGLSAQGSRLDKLGMVRALQVAKPAWSSAEALTVQKQLSEIARTTNDAELRAGIKTYTEALRY